MRSLPRIVIVAVDQAKLLDIAGPLQVFEDARLEVGSPANDVTVVCEDRGRVTAETGLALPSASLNKVLRDNVDTLLIAGGETRCSSGKIVESAYAKGSCR